MIFIVGLAAILWGLKKIFIVLLIFGLVLSFFSDSRQEAFLSLKIIQSFAPVLEWFVTHSLALCLILTLYLVARLLKSLERVEIYQRKQSFILGGFSNYLNVTEFKYSYGIEEMKEVGLNVNTAVNVAVGNWFKGKWARLFAGPEGEETILGTDPFDTYFKRGDKIITLIDDLREIDVEFKNRNEH